MANREDVRRDLKDLLLQEGVVTLEELNQALHECEKNKSTLLDTLLSKEKAQTRKIMQLLAQHYNYSIVNPELIIVEPEILQLLPKDAIKKYVCLPLSRYENTLTIAFANPLNLKVLDEVRAICGLRIKAVVADAALLKKAFTRYYDQAAAPSQALDTGEGGEQLDDLVKMIDAEHREDGGDKADLMKVAFETPVIKLVNMLLMESIRRRASDIFVEPWENFVRVRARVDGMLEEVLRPPKTLGPAIISRIKVMSELDIAEHRIPQDGRFKVKITGREVDMRVSILPTCFGEKVCMRILDTKAQSHDISKLGFNDKEQQIIKDSARHPHGMILVTGPTGSGKTTTLYSVLKYLDSPEHNITTVEDPVEYQMPGLNQVQVKEHIGLTFPGSLRSILRQDPDIILIGEIRDQQTLDISIKAALTGHLVLSTLHTNDAASSITRMVNMGLEPFLISSTVLMISAQRLVRKLCSKCRVPEEVTNKEILRKVGLGDKEKATFFKGKGCAQCRQSGYTGRSVITEILEMTPEVRELIMEGKTAEHIKKIAHDHGMTTLRECAVRKALAGDTSLEEVFRMTSEDQGFEEEEKKAPAKAGKAAA